MSFPVYQAKEWQCRFVFANKQCCRLAIGHSGEHSLTDAVETARRLRANEIVRNHGSVDCIGRLLDSEPFCNVAPKDHPLCATCQSLADEIFDALVRDSEGGRADVEPTEKCDHKFIDSNHCLKCGWTPPAAGAGTPPAEQQATIMNIVIRRVEQYRVDGFQPQADAVWNFAHELIRELRAGASVPASPPQELKDFKFHFHGDHCYAIGPGDTEVRICGLAEKWERERGIFGRREAAAELRAAALAGVPPPRLLPAVTRPEFGATEDGEGWVGVPPPQPEKP